MLVLLPGLDGTGKLLTTFVQALAQVLCAPWETQVIAYPKDEPLGYDELERRVRGALPDDRPFVLLAESFSGPIAIRIAASPARAMRGVILCGTFARNPYPLLGGSSGLPGAHQVAASLGSGAAHVGLEERGPRARASGARHRPSGRCGGQTPHQGAVIDGPHLLLQAAPQECAAAVGQWLLRQPGFT